MRPELVKGMIIPIFDFARMPIWSFRYAPHDAGIYPYCLGQYYAIKNNEEEYFNNYTNYICICSLSLFLFFNM